MLQALAVTGLSAQMSHDISVQEWCKHYIEEGIDHIFLIDNNSTDGYLAHIEDFIKAGRVTLLLDPTRYNQDEIYTRHLTMYLPTVAWMAILDLDEFLYGRNTTIAAYLSNLDDDIGVVRLAWKQFGSSGLIRQPESLVQGFISRGTFNNDNVNIKSIFRSSAVTKLQMHTSEVSPNFRSVSPQRIPKPSGVESGEAALQQHVLHLNHYQLQSREWFLNVKATRGSATTAQEDGLRDAHYFDISDQAYTGIPDYELKSKKAFTENASPYHLWQS